MGARGSNTYTYNECRYICKCIRAYRTCIHLHCNIGKMCPAVRRRGQQRLVAASLLIAKVEITTLRLTTLCLRPLPSSVILYTLVYIHNYIHIYIYLCTYTHTNVCKYECILIVFFFFLVCSGPARRRSAISTCNLNCAATALPLLLIAHCCCLCIGMLVFFSFFFCYWGPRQGILLGEPRTGSCILQAYIPPYVYVCNTHACKVKYIYAYMCVCAYLCFFSV